MSHTGSDGSTLQIRADRQNFPWKSLGENVAVGFHSAKQVVLAWMCSPGHRKNLMSCDFDLIGIGISDSTEGRTYYAQNFACVVGNTCQCGGGGGGGGGQPAQPAQPAQQAQQQSQPPPQQTFQVTTQTKELLVHCLIDWSLS